MTPGGMYHHLDQRSNHADVTIQSRGCDDGRGRRGGDGGTLRFGQRICVMDRGMTSDDNLEWLRDTGRRYLVGTPKSELKK